MTSNATLLLALLTFIIGFSVPTQAGINSQLSRFVGNPILASLISFAVGTVALLVVVLGLRVPFPTMEKLASVPWWAWTGGVFGTLFVTIVIIMAPRLGATTTLSLLVAGQMLASLVFDHYGVLGFPDHPISWMRVLGAGLLVAGVLLIRW